MSLSNLQLDQKFLVAINKLVAGYLTNVLGRISRVQLIVYFPGTDLALKHSLQIFNRVAVVSLGSSIPDD